MPKLSHKHIVRYFSCWIEAVEPDIEVLNRAILQVQQTTKQKSIRKLHSFAAKRPASFLKHHRPKRLSEAALPFEET